jgi:hypothetical protein
MRRLALLLIAALSLFGCVRETVACTVLAHDDPLCQDPDADVDADTDAAVEDAATETDADLDGGG